MGVSIQVQGYENHFKFLTKRRKMISRHRVVAECEKKEDKEHENEEDREGRPGRPGTEEERGGQGKVDGTTRAR